MYRDVLCCKKWELLSPGHVGRGVPQGFALPLVFFTVTPFLMSELSLSK